MDLQSMDANLIKYPVQTMFESMEVTINPHFMPINLAYIIHSGFISGYQNRYGDNLKPPTNVYHRMTA